MHLFVCECVFVCLFFCYPKKDFAICCGVSAGAERLLHCKRHYIMIISDFAVSANFVCVCVCVCVCECVFVTQRRILDGPQKIQFAMSGTSLYPTFVYPASTSVTF